MKRFLLILPVALFTASASHAVEVASGAVNLNIAGYFLTTKANVASDVGDVDVDFIDCSEEPDTSTDHCPAEE